MDRVDWSGVGRAWTGIDRDAIRDERLGQLATRDQKLATARMAMRKADAQLQLGDYFAKMYPSLSPEQAIAMAGAVTAGSTPEQVTGALGDLLKQGYQRSSRDAAVAGDPTRANAEQFGNLTRPVELAKIQGDTLINPYAIGGGQPMTTEVGRARIANYQERAAGGAQRLRQVEIPRSDGTTKTMLLNTATGQYIEPDFGGQQMAGAPGLQQESVTGIVAGIEADLGRQLSQSELARVSAAMANGGTFDMPADTTLGGMVSPSAPTMGLRPAKSGVGPGRNFVFQATDPVTGQQLTAVSADGRTYVDAQGNARPIPPDAVILTKAQAAPAMAANRGGTQISDLIDQTLAEAPPAESGYETAVKASGGPMVRLGVEAAPIFNALGMTDFGRKGQESEAFVNLINEGIKKIVSNNPRYPQWQNELLRGIIPGPAILGFEGEAIKARELERKVVQQIAENKDRIARATTPKEKQALADDTQQFIFLLHQMRQGNAPAKRERAPAPRIVNKEDSDLAEQTLRSLGL